MVAQDTDWEVVEPENYSGTKGESFSNGELVMMAFRKCIELGAKEMRDGYYNTKMDRAGNVNYIYVPDTRKEFIESVETLLMIMEDDVDEITKKAIDEVNHNLSEIYIKLLNNEKDVWEEASLQMQKQWNARNIFYREGFLSAALPFATDYLIEKVTAYRKIVGVVKKRLKEMNYYKEEMWHA